MKKNKEPLTPSQEKKKYRKIKIACFGGEFVSAILPFFIIGLVNYNEYFVEYDGTKMSIACFLAVTLMGIAVYLISKKKLENSFITLIIGWYTAGFIFHLIGVVINDISTIMFIGGTGLIGAYGLELGSKKADKKLKKITDAMQQAESEITKEAYKEEIKETEAKKVIKVKVKK